MTNAKGETLTMLCGKMRKWTGGEWIRAEKRLAINLRDDMTCQYCGKNLKDAGPGEVSLDHLTPRSESGGNEASNLITVCTLCNKKRGTRDWRDYAPAGAQERIEATILKPLNVKLAKALIAGKAGDKSEAAR